MELILAEAGKTYISKHLRASLKFIKWLLHHFTEEGKSKNKQMNKNKPPIYDHQRNQSKLYNTQTLFY